MSSSGIHTSARTGFANGAAYDQYRPAYLSNIVEGLLEQLRVLGKKHAKILDLAAGTGKFTESLVARQDEEYQIVAVEPHADMRKVLEEKKLHGVTVRDGKASSIPLEDESVDAVICAQVGRTRFRFSFSQRHLKHDNYLPIIYCSRFFCCLGRTRAKHRLRVGLPLVRQHGIAARYPSRAPTSRRSGPDMEP